jgi:hypothetical protein
MRSLLLLSLLALPAVAQTTRDAKQQKTELVFTGPDLIDGTGQAPDVELVQQAARPKHESLLRPRADFRKQALDSVHAL